ncbi:class I SAM-dependent methyltransferase [Spirillospora sp. NBC_00431]
MTHNTEIDEGRVEELMFRTLGYFTGAAVTAGVGLGDRLGLYRALAGAGGPGLTSDELASATATHPRLVREWLDGQAAAGLVRYDAGDDRYALTAEAALVLVEEDSPAFIMGGADICRSNYLDLDRIEAAFRGDGALSWCDHDESLFRGTGRFFRTSWRNFVTTAWIPALDGVQERLTAGGRVADVGCGTGYATVLIAESFPQAEVAGFDFHEPSLELARAHAAETGVAADRLRFVRADALGYQGTYDLITFFDCFHDLGDPVAAARHARRHLTDGGSVLLAEHYALDDRAANHSGNPQAAMAYHESAFLCAPNALSQPVGRALGAQAGESAFREVFEEAGYGHFRRVAETAFNIVFEAKA